MTANWSNTTPAELRDVFLRTGPANTRAAYRADLGSFQAFLKSASMAAAVKAFCDMSPGEAMGMMERYKAAMRDDQYSANTVRRRIGSVLGLSAKAKSMDVIAWSIRVALPKASTTRDTSGPLVANVLDMIAHCQAREDAKGWRDAAIIALMFYHAMRAAEVLSIDLKHFQSGLWARVSVQAKARWDRETVYLSMVARDAVDRWLQCRGFDPGQMFTTMNRATRRGGAGLTYRGLYRIIRDVGAAVGIICHPHALRHAAITEALRKTGGNIVDTMELSRHKDPRTVMEYLSRMRFTGRKVAELIADQGPVSKRSRHGVDKA